MRLLDDDDRDILKDQLRRYAMAFTGLVLAVVVIYLLVKSCSS